MGRWWWMAALVGCRGAPWCDLPEPEVVEQPNLLVVVIDDVGIGQLDRWDAQDPVPTPTIDCLCDAGLRFDQVWASPFCTPARVALLSGLHPRREGVGRFINVGQSTWELPLPWVTLAEAVAPVGYSTAFYGKWHIGAFDAPSGRDHPNLQGFTDYSGGLGNIDHLSDLGPKGTYFAWEHLTNGAARWREGYLTSATIDDALEGLAEIPEPWMVILSLHGAHSPLHRPPSELRGQTLGPAPSNLNLYRTMVESVDTELGRFFEGVEPSVLARTQVWTMSDNGTPDHGIPESAGILGSKGSLFEAGTRIPLVITGSGVGARGERTAALTSILDVFPTLLEQAGAPSRPNDGLSLSSHLDEPGLHHHDVVYADLSSPDGEVSRAVRTDDRKLVREADGSEQAYALGTGLTEWPIDEDLPDLRAALDAFTSTFAEPPELR